MTEKPTTKTIVLAMAYRDLLSQGALEISESDSIVDVEKELIRRDTLEKMSEETKNFLHMVLNAPTEYLDSLFGAKVYKLYHRDRILSWLKKQMPPRKASQVIKELRQFAETVC